jgi:hypothetical protein
MRLSSMIAVVFIPSPHRQNTRKFTMVNGESPPPDPCPPALYSRSGGLTYIEHAGASVSENKFQKGLPGGGLFFLWDELLTDGSRDDPLIAPVQRQIPPQRP